MTHLLKNILKSKFETGDKPTQFDYFDLIDSSYNEEGITSLPSQSVSGSSDKILSSNGVSSSWIDPPTSLPEQTGNEGKFLTTDGTSASWDNVSILTADQQGAIDYSNSPSSANPFSTLEDLASLAATGATHYLTTTTTGSIDYQLGSTLSLVSSNDGWPKNGVLRTYKSEDNKIFQELIYREADSSGIYRRMFVPGISPALIKPFNLYGIVPDGSYSNSDNPQNEVLSTLLGANAEYNITFVDGYSQGYIKINASDHPELQGLNNYSIIVKYNNVTGLTENAGSSWNTYNEFIVRGSFRSSDYYAMGTNPDIASVYLPNSYIEEFDIAPIQFSQPHYAKISRSTLGLLKGAISSDNVTYTTILQESYADIDALEYFRVNDYGTTSSIEYMNVYSDDFISDSWSDWETLLTGKIPFDNSRFIGQISTYIHPTMSNYIDDIIEDLVNKFYIAVDYNVSNLRIGSCGNQTSVGYIIDDVNVQHLGGGTVLFSYPQTYGTYAGNRSDLPYYTSMPGIDGYGNITFTKGKWMINYETIIESKADNQLEIVPYVNDNKSSSYVSKLTFKSSKHNIPNSISCINGSYNTIELFRYSKIIGVYNNRYLEFTDNDGNGIEIKFEFFDDDSDYYNLHMIYDMELSAGQPYPKLQYQDYTGTWYDLESGTLSATNDGWKELHISLLEMTNITNPLHIRILYEGASSGDKIKINQIYHDRFNSYASANGSLYIDATYDTKTIKFHMENEDSSFGFYHWDTGEKVSTDDIKITRFSGVFSALQFTDKMYCKFTISYNSSLYRLYHYFYKLDGTLIYSNWISLVKENNPDKIWTLTMFGLTFDIKESLMTTTTNPFCLKVLPMTIYKFAYDIKRLGT